MSATDDPLRGRIAFDGTSTPLKTALFVRVCAAWLVPGLIGHDPWKYDEAVVFGIVNEILRSGDWINLKLAGEPYFDKAPLFIWVATALAKALGGVMPLQDAARLAAGVFMAATLALLSATSIELVAERGIRLSVLLFIGCLGLLIRAHEMTTDLAGLTGVALGLYGLALSGRSPRAGGLALGAGMGLGFLGNGFLPAGMLLALMVVLPACGAFWRTRSYLETVAIAIAVALPLAAIWPVLLASQSPDDPGMPVLSSLAGAAQELGEAILVNPFDEEGMADAIWHGLEMPLGERKERWTAMMATLRRNDARAWHQDFVEALAAVAAVAR